jgi:hypothetical protein
MSETPPEVTEEPVVSEEEVDAAVASFKDRYQPPPPTVSILEQLGLVPAVVVEPAEPVVSDEEAAAFEESYRERYEPVVYPTIVEVAQKCLDRVDDGPFMSAPGPEAQEPAAPPPPPPAG